LGITAIVTAIVIVLIGVETRGASVEDIGNVDLEDEETVTAK
jgi:hypothetical protein